MYFIYCVIYFMYVYSIVTFIYFSYFFIFSFFTFRNTEIVCKICWNIFPGKRESMNIRWSECDLGDKKKQVQTPTLRIYWVSSSYLLHFLFTTLLLNFTYIFTSVLKPTYRNNIHFTTGLFIRFKDYFLSTGTNYYLYLQAVAFYFLSIFLYIVKIMYFSHAFHI